MWRLVEYRRLESIAYTENLDEYTYKSSLSTMPYKKIRHKWYHSEQELIEGFERKVKNYIKWTANAAWARLNDNKFVIEHYVDNKWVQINEWIGPTKEELATKGRIVSFAEWE